MKKTKAERRAEALKKQENVFYLFKIFFGKPLSIGLNVYVLGGEISANLNLTFLCLTVSIPISKFNHFKIFKFENCNKGF